MIADSSGAITNGFTLGFGYKPTWCSSPIVFKLMRQLLLSKWNSNKKVLNCFTSFFRVWGKEAVYEHFDDELVLEPDVVEPVEPVKDVVEPVADVVNVVEQIETVIVDVEPVRGRGKGRDRSRDRGRGRGTLFATEFLDTAAVSGSSGKKKKTD